MQNSKGEGCPVATVRMHRRVFWGAWWNLRAQISVTHQDQDCTLRKTLKKILHLLKSYVNLDALKLMHSL